MKTAEVTCDHCGENLTGKIVQVLNKTVVSAGHGIQPHFPDETHFCNLNCLHRWLSKKMES